MSSDPEKLISGLPICSRDDLSFSPSVLAFADDILRNLAKISRKVELWELMNGLARELNFRYWALIHHDDLRELKLDRVDIKKYPAGATERIIDAGHYRRDPIIRACLYSGSAFIWSRLNRIMILDQHDRAAFEKGAKEGLNEGITIPYLVFGECPGSCTFAGINHPEKVERVMGLVQTIGVFAFQTARRLTGSAPLIKKLPRLYPRVRDCIVLAGRGYSNKKIARVLGITPR